MSTPDLVLTVRRPPGEARVYRFGRAPVTVGRDAACSISLPDADVSSEHLRFLQRGGQWVALDPGSTHGTRLGRRRMARGRPYPLQSAEALAVGPYLVEVFLDAGGGLTTDSRDTGGIAATLAAEVRDRGAGGPALWVLQGPAAGRSLPLGRHRPLLLGGHPDADLPLPGDHHVQVGLDARGRVRVRSAGGAVRVRGQSTRDAPLFPEDHLAIGDTVLQLRGAAAPAAGWTPLERFVVLLLLGAVATLAWTWFGR